MGTLTRTKHLNIGCLCAMLLHSFLPHIGLVLVSSSILKLSHESARAEKVSVSDSQRAIGLRRIHVEFSGDPVTSVSLQPQFQNFEHSRSYARFFLGNIARVIYAVIKPAFNPFSQKHMCNLSEVLFHLKLESGSSCELDFFYRWS